MGYYNLISLMSPKGPSFDPDAQLFITNAAITDSTQQSAVNNLVINLKGYGIWSKMKAIYPFIGGTSTQHKFNLKNPLDTDAAFRLVFNGGWTHSSTGALPNGTNAYANSFLILDNELGTDRPHISYYSRTNANTATDQIDMGVFNNSAYCWISAWYNGSGFSNVLARNTSTSVLLNGGTTTDSRGLYQTNKILTVSKLQKNSSILDTKTDTTGNVTEAPIYIGALNNFGSAFNFSNRQTAFNAIGSGLTDTEAANYYTAVQTFQTTLNRQVGVPIVADSDAQAFLNAAVIEDVTQANAVNTLVTDLKGYGIWTKMKALYPFVGGTATQHKFNLKNPLDTDAAFRLVFSGGVTHDSNGITGNKVNAFANTFLSDSTILSANSKHIAMYQRNILPAESGGSMGISTDNRFYLNSGGSNYSTLGMAQSPFTIQTPQKGMFCLSKTADGQFKYFQNALTPITKTGTNVVNIKVHYLLASSNIPFSPDVSNANLALASLGDGLSDTEYTNYNIAVQAFQTSLSRNV